MCRRLHQHGTPGAGDMQPVPAQRQPPTKQGSSTLASKVAAVLKEAWLQVLQAHPASLPCAHVLYFDDVAILKQTLNPCMRADMHSVLSNPLPWLEHVGASHLSTKATYMRCWVILAAAIYRATALPCGTACIHLN
jgi:hypothetical protein